jgi:hypothetical protein
MRALRLSVAVVALALALVAAAAPAPAQPPSPEAFMTRVLRLTVEARYAQAWTLLHPAHQRLAPRGRFVRCRSADPTIAPYRLVSARFVEKRYVRIDSPGVPQKTSTQVVIRFRIADAQGRMPPAADATVRAVWIDTRWAWVLPDREIPAFRAGRCPS